MPPKYPKVVFTKGRFNDSERKTIEWKVQMFWDVAHEKLDKIHFKTTLGEIEKVRVGLHRREHRRGKRVCYAHFSPFRSRRRMLHIFLTPRSSSPNYRYCQRYDSVYHELLHGMVHLSWVAWNDGRMKSEEWFEEFVVQIATTGMYCEEFWASAKENHK